jgi:hypothetical protein
MVAARPHFHAATTCLQDFSRALLGIYQASCLRRLERYLRYDFEECIKYRYPPHPVHRALAAYVAGMPRDPKTPFFRSRGSEQPHPWNAEQIGSMEEAGVDAKEEIRVPHAREGQLKMRVELNQAILVRADIELLSFQA